ncbi:MAG: hypothetical protein HGB17_06555 [Syntrophobacteraceae bacterium]|nr:hypothetical protein [Syntrophobacteraceae bacterium]
MTGQDIRPGREAGPAIRIGITQVEYTADGAPLIHIFGRDPEGKACHIQVTGFRPYFYVPASQAGSTAIPASVTVEEGKRTGHLPLSILAAGRLGPAGFLPGNGIGRVVVGSVLSTTPSESFNQLVFGWVD